MQDISKIKMKGKRNMKTEFRKENKTQRICGVGISQRVSKDGITTYQLRKARPRKAGQPRKSEFSMTWQNSLNLTGKKLETALNEQVRVFLQAYDEDISGGISARPKDILFSDYAQAVLKIKQTQGVKKSTLSRYEALLVRINARFGNTPIKDITTTSLNAFYADLMDTKIDKSTKALCKVNLNDILKPFYITKVDISNATGLSMQTINACIATKTKAIHKIEYDNAQLITDAINTLMHDAEKLANTNRIRTNNKLPYLHPPKSNFKVSDLFDAIESTATLSPKTVREYHRLISTICEQAVLEDVITRNPAARATPPKIEQKEVGYFEPDIVKQIRECMEREIATAQKPNYRARAFLYLALSTGCRRGEIVGLKWNSIDFENNIIAIENTLLHNSKYGTYTDTPKTKNSIRKLILDPLTKKALLEYKESTEKLKAKNKNKWQDNGFIFIREDGSPVNPDSFTRWCSKFAQRNNLPHIHPHQFRHTLASIMLHEKADLIAVSKYLGHSKPSVTSDIYAHVLRNANIELGQDISKFIMGATENP